MVSTKSKFILVIIVATLAGFKSKYCDITSKTMLAFTDTKPMVRSNLDIKSIQHTLNYNNVAR